MTWPRDRSSRACGARATVSSCQTTRLCREYGDPLHLLHAIRHQLVLVSKNHDDFRDLHLLVQAASGRHSGIVIVRADNDPRRDMSDGDIARSFDNLQAANVPIANEFHILNHWR